ncbi:DUF4747 family protein [Shewanella sp. DW31]|uniref:DUF4747 family protein n=1 Tax=Shewanella sp. DW31 TaxID=2699422 RepID=UPI0018E36B5F|nr:DUF4747 family protein [Shewanella sp. DW31]MBI1675940.1 DUF4747 family protein [Shewanella sp. DW31]
MTNINYYNIQALPTESDDNEIGVDGYREIFITLKELSKKAISEKNIVDFAHKIWGDNYISFFDVRANTKFAKGIIKKFKHVEKVLDVRNSKQRHNSQGLGAVELYEYIFVFDYERHILAIESANAPDTKVVIEFLTKQFSSAIEINNPKHHLTVDILSDPQKIGEVLKNIHRIKKAEMRVTFSNSQDWADFVAKDCQEEIENELKENKIVSCEHTEKSAKNSTMTLSKYGKALVGLSKKFGSTKIKYLDENNKVVTFDSDNTENAISLPISSLGGRSLKNTSYITNIFESIKVACKRIYQEN